MKRTVINNWATEETRIHLYICSNRCHTLFSGCPWINAALMTSLWTLTDKGRHTEELYHHPPHAHGLVHMLVACWAYTTITQFMPQVWVLTDRCIPVRPWRMYGNGRQGSWMGSIANVAACMDTRCKTRRCPPHAHMHIIYMWQLRIENVDYFGS